MDLDGVNMVEYIEEGFFRGVGVVGDGKGGMGLKGRGRI